MYTTKYKVSSKQQQIMYNFNFGFAVRKRCTFVNNAAYFFKDRLILMLTFWTNLSEVLTFKWNVVQRCKSDSRIAGSDQTGIENNSTWWMCMSKHMRSKKQWVVVSLVPRNSTHNTKPNNVLLKFAIVTNGMGPKLSMLW